MRAPPSHLLPLHPPPGNTPPARARRSAFRVSCFKFPVSAPAPRVHRSSFRVQRSAFRVRPAFTLIELLVVMAIIGILVAVTMPAIRALTKNNDQAQATSLIRTMLSTARSIAISQHRTAGVVFFQETPAYSLPVHGNQTAMQLIVSDYNQLYYTYGGANNLPYSLSSQNLLAFIPYSTARQYLPEGTQVAMLSDTQSSGSGSGINAVEQANTTAQTRVVLFDPNGQLVLRDNLATYDPTLGSVAGTYPMAFGDWKFLTPTGKLPGNVPGDAYSSPGFFLYSKSEMAAFQQTNTNGDAGLATWLRNHSSVVIVNINTGGILK